MKALVLEKTNELALRDIDVDESLGENDVEIAVKAVGICGSDVHYYKHGRIGDFVVTEPMILGHEAAGEIIKVGSKVKHLKAGDRVCMEPGIPTAEHSTTLLGMYNLDPNVKFWATPPYHGCLRESVVHPASFTYKLPDNVSYGEGAFVEPFAVGVHAMNKAKLNAGSTAVVIGAGTIGVCTAVALKAGGYSKVHLVDIKQEKIDYINSMNITGIQGYCCSLPELIDIVNKESDNWGVDAVFESSGAIKDFKDVIKLLCPNGVLVLIGMPVSDVSIDVVALQAKEVRIETIFRYVNVYKKAISMISASDFPFDKLITKEFNFDDSIEAFDYAANPKPHDIKVMINL